MNRLFQKLAWRIYHTVHTNGMLADAVYGGAFHLNKFRRKWLYASMAKAPVSLDELWPRQQPYGPRPWLNEAIWSKGPRGTDYWDKKQ